MPNIFYNAQDEEHRNWLENFGDTSSFTINDIHNLQEYQGIKKYPVIEVAVPFCSYQETLPEWINPVTGDELGEQTVNINVEQHIGLYYFGTLDEYNTWMTDVHANLPNPVSNADGSRNNLPESKVISIPDIYLRDEE